MVKRSAIPSSTIDRVWVKPSVADTPVSLTTARIVGTSGSSVSIVKIIGALGKLVLPAKSVAKMTMS